MYRNILVAYDESPEARKALNAGIDLAKTTGASLSTITVEEELPPYMAAVETYGAYADPETLQEVQQQRATYYVNLQKHAQEIAVAQGVTLDCAIVLGGEVSSIVEHAQTLNCDLIVVGFHAHSVFADRVLGSTAHAITMTAHCSVLAVK